MKQFISVLLALLLALGLFAGCAAKQNETPAGTDAPIETEAPTETSEAPADTAEPEGAFRFTRENLPRLDGSTALVPLGEAVCSVLLGEDRDAVGDLLQFNRTSQSYRNLMYGTCDLLFASLPSADVYEELDEAGFAIDSEEICTEALVFMVNENNPVSGLTTEQLRGIYTGEITNWKEVGGEDAEIVPFQRNEGAGSQALMRKLVMGDTPMMEPPAEYLVDSMSGLIQSVKDYDNSANAIGYTVYYYAHDMEMAQGLKLLAIDGVEPNRDTIRSRSYPHLSSYFCVIPADAPENSPNRILYNWMMSDAGQALIDAEGYVAVREVG